MQISIRKSFSGKQILLTGASGFLGKVWLSYLLAKLPEIGKIYVLLRRKGSRSAAERFEQLFNTSPAFRPLRERYGADLETYAKSKIEILEGDVSEEDLGLDALTRKRLQRDLDLVVNCAGLVEFDPELRDSISINVLGTLHAADFASKCVRPAFVHVSTTFVAGSRQGRVAEEIHPTLAPNGKVFDPEKELSDVEAALERISQMETDAEVLKSARNEIDERIRKHKVENHNEKRVANLMKLGVRRVVREASVEEGQTRAKTWGWPNIYTYTKSLAESLLVTRYPNLPVTIFRPSIVESSVEYPFPGVE